MVEHLFLLSDVLVLRINIKFTLRHPGLALEGGLSDTNDNFDEIKQKKNIKKEKFWNFRSKIQISGTLDR